MTKKLSKIKCIIIIALVLITGISGIKICITKDITGISTLLLQNVEALASRETGGAIRNFYRTTYWYNSEIAGGIAVTEKPNIFVSGTWVSMVCCGPGTDMDWCDFSMEDSECQRRVQRPAH